MAPEEFGSNSRTASTAGCASAGKEAHVPGSRIRRTSQDLLRAMRKKYDTEREPKKSHHEIVGSVHELFETAVSFSVNFEG